MQGQLIDVHFDICYTGRCNYSREKPGQVGILTHREAKWIIPILLEASALHTVIEQHAAHSSLFLSNAAAVMLEVVCLFPA